MLFVMKKNLTVFVLYYFFLKSQALEKITLEEEAIIIDTESAITNITNEIFVKLRLQKRNPKLRQSLLVHNFFTSVTLKDHNILNLIVKLTRVDDKNTNETMHIMGVINEILNEDLNSAGAESDSLISKEDIIQYFDEFLNNLDGFKESSGFNNEYENLDIKDEIVHILQNDNLSNYNMSQTRVTKGNSMEDGNLLSDNEFWVPEPERRIYQGDKTKIRHFPFMASIHIFNAFQCAGSIIKSDLIITAASCLQLAWNNRFFRENPAFLSVRYGSNFYNGGGGSVPILEVYFHPSYNPKNLRNNIAILRLLKHLNIRKSKKRVRKIEIDREDTNLPMNTAGITIVGWGARGSSNIVHDAWTHQLAHAVLDVYHLQECQEIYSREYVTHSNFCAGFISKGGGACNRDVGGPGVVSGYLTGIISFGSPICGALDAPTVFTKVGYYADWIEEIMELEPPTHRIKTTLKYTKPVTYVEKRTQSTFKLHPVGGKTLKPLPLAQSDTLRILENEKLFKEFLSTMFRSKEAKEYTDLLKEDTVKEDKNIVPILQVLDKPKTEMHEKAIDITYTEKPYLKENTATLEPITDGPDSLYTKMSAFESKKEKHRHTNTKIVNDSVYNEILEKNIVKLIDNIEVSDNDETSTSSSEGSYEQRGHKTSEKLPQKNIVTKNKVLSTMLLTDNEKGIFSNASLAKASKSIEDFDDNFSEGLPIEEEGFNEMTFRKNKNRSVLDFISRNELYDLLSEAIDEVTKNKIRKRSYFFYLLDTKPKYKTGTYFFFFANGLTDLFLNKTG